MDVFEGKNKRYRKQLYKVLQSKPRARRHVCCELSRALSRDPSSDCAIPRAEVRVKALGRVVQSPVKVIPLKLSYYQTFFETWHSLHS